jgi:DDE superfamily endonuclease
MFLDVNIGFPGSCGDSTIWQSTDVAKMLASRPDDDGWRGFMPPHCFIVGDGAYPLVETMMTPYQRSSLSSFIRFKYNFVQSRARRCVEQTFGILKKVWRLLDMLTEHSKEQKITDTHCCCILHNLILRYRSDVNTPIAVKADLDAVYCRLLEEVNLEILLRPDREGHQNMRVVSGSARREEVARQINEHVILYH